jgi:DNA-directed RNA polymerase specialized sigma24 family protein
MQLNHTGLGVLQRLEPAIQQVAAHYASPSFSPLCSAEDIAQDCRINVMAVIHQQRRRRESDIRAAAVHAAHNAAKQTLRRENAKRRTSGYKLSISEVLIVTKPNGESVASGFEITIEDSTPTKYNLRKQLEARDMLRYAYNNGSYRARCFLRVLFAGRGYKRDGTVSVRVCGDLAGLNWRDANSAFKEIRCLLNC